MKETELRVDRIEEGLAVAYDDDGREYTFCAKLADAAETIFCLPHSAKMTPLSRQQS